MPYTFVDVRLQGTRVDVWFVHSVQGLLLGPFGSSPEAEECCRNLTMSDLIVANRIPRGQLLPRFANFVETPVSGAAIWELAFENGRSLYFNVVRGGPVCGTMGSSQRAGDYLQALYTRVSLWRS